MRKVLLTIVVAIAMISCGQQQTKKDGEDLKEVFAKLLKEDMAAAFNLDLDKMGFEVLSLKELDETITVDSIQYTVWESTYQSNNMTVGPDEKNVVTSRFYWNDDKTDFTTIIE